MEETFDNLGMGGGRVKKKRIDINQISAWPRPGGRVPGAFRFSAENSKLYYLYAQEGLERALWMLDLTTGTTRIVARVPHDPDQETFDDEMTRQRARLQWSGITAFWVYGDVVMVLYHGKVYLSENGSPLKAVVGSEGFVAPSLSLDGNRVFGVRDGNLWSLDRKTNLGTPLTDGAVDGLTYGLAEYIAQEELGRSEGYWSSPDGRWMALAEVDERHLPLYPIAHQNRQGAWVESHRYPFVGRKNAKVRLGILSLTTPQDPIAWIDLGEAERYLLDVVWSEMGQVFVLTLARNHQHLQWDVYDTQGVWVRRAYEEISPTWIVRPPTSFITGNGTIVSTSESAGLRRLLVAPESGPVQLLLGNQNDEVVLDVLALDRDKHLAYVWATRHCALERTLLAIDWVNGDSRELTPDAGWHSIVASDDARFFVDVWSSLERPPLVQVRSDSDILHTLTGQEELADSEPFCAPTLFTAAAEDGTRLNGLIYIPLGTAPPGGWPLVDSVYGGPMAQTVMNAWAETVDLEAQYFAQQGIAVMRLDNRGSANRGREFEKVLHGHFGDVELADQIAGLRSAAQKWPINLHRVGIYGWSYGGYMTIRAMLMAPQTFRVGVAGAPVTDFRWYDTAYTERYLGTDDNNPQGYDSTSLINKAERLQGKLLLMHGLVDENVHFRHSAALIEAFIQAGRDFDLLVLPNARHMVTDQKVTQYRARRLVEYFERYL